MALGRNPPYRRLNLRLVAPRTARQKISVVKPPSLWYCVPAALGNEYRWLLDKAKLWGQRSDKWFPETRGRRGSRHSRMKVFSWTMNVYLYRSVKTHHILHFKRMTLTLCKLHLNKPDFHTVSNPSSVALLLVFMESVMVVGWGMGCGRRPRRIAPNGAWEAQWKEGEGWCGSKR